MFIYVLTNFESRTTIDIDFLIMQTVTSSEDIKKIVNDIIEVDTGNNEFIQFEARSFGKISLQRKYEGFSAQLIGRIKNTKTPINIDFGVGDVIVPKAEKRLMPTQLCDYESPEITTYSIESTIAEKFDAMLQRLELNSRMKDFFDIYYLAGAFDFDGRKLQEAILETLTNRRTEYNKESFSRIISFSEDRAMIKKWNAFIRKQKIKELPLEEVLNIIDFFLGDLFAAITLEKEFYGFWQASKISWQKTGDK